MNSEYIKMVLALPEEFFKGWKWNDGDQVYLTEEIDEYSCSDEHGLYTVFDDLVCNAGFTCTEDWLYVRAIDFKNGRPIPSQGQLQDIIKSNFKNNGLVFEDRRENLYLEWRFEIWNRDQIFEEKTGLSFECLWLMFLMYAIFDKMWRGEAWI